MAYLTVNSKFNPYTFEELYKPFALYDAAYKQAVEQNNELLEKAAALEDMSPTVDKEAYEAYQDWKGQLKAVSDQLASSGLSQGIKSTIRELGNTYRTEYLPNVEKLKTRGALIKEQREYLQKHPNAFFDVDYSITPVDKVSSSSTYTSYDPDQIETKVAKDAYSRLVSGDPAMSAEDYTAMFAEGLTDTAQIERIAQAVESGTKVAKANYTQQEFENYLNKVKAFRTGRSSGGSGYSGATTSTSRGTFTPGKGGDILLPDGTAVKVSYDKATGNYHYTDINKKRRVATITNGQLDPDEVVGGYYGGEYARLNVGGLNTARISDNESYMIRDAKGSWKALPHRDKSSARELFKAYYGTDVSLPTNTEKSGLAANYTSKAFNKDLKGEKLTVIEDANPYDYIGNIDVPGLDGLAKKLVDLDSKGLLKSTGLKVYIKNGRVAAFESEPEYTIDWNAPIEKQEDEDFKD